MFVCMYACVYACMCLLMVGKAGSSKSLVESARALGIAALINTMRDFPTRAGVQWRALNALRELASESGACVCYLPFLTLVACNACTNVRMYVMCVCCTVLCACSHGSLCKLSNACAVRRIEPSPGCNSWWHWGGAHSDAFLPS